MDQSALGHAVRHAEFDATGARLAGVAGFLDGGLAECVGYVAGYDSADGHRIDDAAADMLALRWQRPGSVFEVATDGGVATLLTSHPTAAGGLCLMAVDRPPVAAIGPLAGQLAAEHPLPMWINDARTGNILYINNAARQMFELDPVEHGMGNAIDLFPDTEDNLQVVADLRARGAIDNYVIRCNSMTGRELWLRGSASMIERDGGSYVMVVLNHVTSREDHFAEVVRNRDLLNDALRAFSVGFALFDEDGSLIVSNDRYRELNAGIEEFIAPGTHWETMLREMTRRRLIRQAVGREAVWVRETVHAAEDYESFEFERSDGRIISTEAHPTALGGFILSQTDTTARRRAEEAAHNSEQLLSSILEASPANLCMSRIGDGEIIYQSPASVSLFGSDSSARRHFADPLDRADFLTELLPTGIADDFRAEATNARGEAFPALFSARVIEYRGEDVMVSTVTDLTDRLAGERRLRDASIRLRDAIEALEEGFVLFDADERLVIANRRYLEMNAPYASMIVTGAQNRDLLIAARNTGHFVDAESWLADHDRELAEGIVGTQRGYEFQLTDGTWINSVRRPTRDGGFVITWLDVTEQRNATTELGLVNDRLRDAIESLEHGFALYDRNDRLVTWNTRYVEFNDRIRDHIREGISYPELLDHAIAAYDLTPAEAADVRKSGTRDEGNRRFRFEFENSDGRWFSVSRHPTSDDGFVITRLDITERKRMEAAQREEDEMTRRIMDACPAAMVMSRMDDLQNVYRNAADRATYGADRPANEFWADQGERQRFLDTVAARGGVDEMQVTMVRRDGTDFPALMSGRTVDFRGEPFMVTYTYDISERAAMEGELAHQRDMLHQSEKLSALGELLAGVAHELNNPLSVVVGHSLMLEEEIDDPSLLARTGKISAAAERCSRIVKTFLAMARQRPARLEDIGVNTVVSTALDVAGYGLRSAGAAIECHLAPDLPPVLADADQLAQVLANLIVNAEHVLAGKGTEGRLTITTRPTADGKEVVIEVADNGPGIPEPIRSRIFEPFFTTKTVGEGTGIGLAFCHRIIESHKGRIRAENMAGGGARFVIHLAATKPGSAAAEAADEPAAGRGSVLVIDDEAEVAELIAGVLKKDGYRVTVAGTAEAGLALLPGGFDVILSDLNMPGMGGRAFLAAVRQEWPELEQKIGFITGDTMSPGAETFLTAAGRPFLEKPVTLSDVRRLASGLLADP